MTFLSLKHPTFLRHCQTILQTLAPSHKGEITPQDLQEDIRANRDFILEMLDENPHAFESELDIQNMARLYRCKY